MERVRLTRRTLLGSTVLLLASPVLAETDRPVYRNPRAAVADRVRDLLSRMTLEEKAAQMRCLWQRKPSIMNPDGSFSAEKAATSIPHGIGQIARPGDTVGTKRAAQTAFRTGEDTVDFVNAVQRYHVEKTRLGIPALFHEELAHGFSARGATIFPIPPGLASTWDPVLVEQVYTVAAREARSRGVTVALSPVLDLSRDPRYGRVEEFFGEDPWLVARMGVAAVRGLQGPVRPLARDRVFATLKHFVHGVPQGGINLAPAEMTERTLREAYLVPFQQVIRESNPAIVMPSYNEVAGVPSHESKDLLEGTGRGRLMFKGAYFSDYDGVSNLVTQHHVAANDEDAAVLAISAGVDAELPDGRAFEKLPELVRAGRIPIGLVDAAVARILSLKFEAGLFEQPYTDPARMRRALAAPAHIALAREAAQKSIVLLKNDGVLPLNPAASIKLAVIGPNATEALFGGYSGVNSKAVGVLAGIRAAASPNIQVDHADGVWITEPDPTGEHTWGVPLRHPAAADNAIRIAEAVALAKRSDVIVLVLGDRPEITRESVRFDAPGDRSTLGLFGDQDALVEAMIATGKPLVSILLNGRPLAVARLAERANALIEGWYLGQEGGHAVADVLFGKVNPSGKLTVSFPRSTGELPVYYGRHPSADLNQYVESKRSALFPFGHGLSYASFEISEPRLSKPNIGRADTVTVEVDVANTGKRVGDEVVQLYIRDDVSSVPRPVLELRAFERVTVQPGHSRTVRFQLTPDMLAFWDIEMKWVVESGSFTVSAGGSSATLKSVKLMVV